MSLVLNGTDGLSDVDGSAATPAIRGTDANTGIFFPAADTIAFSEGGTEVMRIDSSGNVCIGTSSPGAKLDVSNGMVRLSPAYQVQWFNGATQLASILGDSGSNITFQTGSSNTERARIDSSGNLLVGTTSSGAYTARTTLSTNAGTTKWDLGPYSTATNFIVSNGTGGVVLVGSATSWSAVSDERLKTELKPIENAAAKVASLRAGTGRYLTDDESVSRVFLIAQDVQAVLPEAVDVSEDEQLTLMLRYTDTVPLLVAAIQEQQAIITALTARVAALEGTQP